MTTLTVQDITQWLEALAPLSLQESYDNAGLLTGHPEQAVSRILVSLDATEAVIDEAIARQCQLVVAHHPIIFGGLKKLNGKNYVERTVIKAIKHDIALYAIHTNLDNIRTGVNQKIGNKLGLENLRILSPTKGNLKKLSVFVPTAHATAVRDALFAAGCGRIGKYADCAFQSTGTGTYTADSDARPFAGEPGKPHEEPEVKLETIFPAHLQPTVIRALLQAHPYEEVAYDIYSLDNENPETGSGMIGTLPEPMTQPAFLAHVKERMDVHTIRYTQTAATHIRKVAVCGGAGSFLIKQALSAGADAYITADVKYHEFFDAENRLMIADIGHYESEIFTKELLKDVILEKFPTFAVLLSETITNPINYFNS